MDDIYVTILTNDGKHEVMPNMTGENSKGHAQQKAEYWASLGYTVRVGHVRLLDKAITEGGHSAIKP